MKKYTKKIKGSVVFMRFLLSYLIMMFIPILLFSNIIIYTTNEIRKNVAEKSLYVLSSSRDKIDNKMKSIYSCVVGVNYNSIINRVLDSTSNSDVQDLMLSFHDISSFEQGKDSIYVYSDNMDSLLTSKGSYSRIKTIYGSVLKYGNMTYDEFHNVILEGNYQNKFLPAVKVKANSRTFSSILYVQSIPLGTAGPKLGNVLYFIDEASVLEPLEKLSAQNEGWSCIVSKAGEVISSSGDYPINISEILDENKTSSSEFSFEHDGTIITAAVSGFNGWNYVSGISKSHIFKKLNFIKIIIIILFMIYMLFGISFSLFISKKNIKPLEELLGMFSEAGASKGKNINEYQILKEYLMNLTQSNTELSSSVSDYSKKFERFKINHLICGKYNAEEEINELQLPDITNRKLYAVAILDFFPELGTIDAGALDDLTVRRLMILKFLSELNLKDMIFTEIDVNRIGMLFFSDDNNFSLEDAMIQKICEINNKLKDVINANVCVGIGASCKGAMQIAYSFVQADCALRSALNNGAEVMHYQQIPRGSGSYYLPENLRTTLLQAVKDGNLKQAKSVLKILDIENFTSRNLSPLNAERFIEEIHLILVHLCNDSELKENLEVDKNLEVHDKFYAYSKILLTLCNMNTDIALCQKNKFNQDFLNFIDQNYSDSNLCLSMLATHFNLSESYLSYLFKKNLNVNFSNYLENKRIEEAKNILEKEDCPVEQIAERVGYNSPHTFRRAFKKVTGMNPRDIRNK